MAPSYSQAAVALQQLGVKAGDRMAVFAPQPWDEGGSFVARLCRAKIVAESRDVSRDWASSPQAMAQITRVLRNEGVKVVLLDSDPGANAGWVRLAQTRYYAYILVR